MLTQTLAVFADAYRELNARKLFWFVLAISFLVVAAFGAVGLNDKGISILWWQFDTAVFNSRLIAPSVFYKVMFVTLGVKFWLAWFATILALVSTAGIVPDFIAGGSIELSLSKPIGRARMFLTKYASGLTFAALQVTAFSLGAFLVMGLRGGSWEPGVFWAIPIMVAFFSYLFCVCALLGLVTRSTIASLLLTLLVWFGIFGLHTTEQLALGLRIGNEVRIETLARFVENLEQQQRDGRLGAGDAQNDGPDAAQSEPPVPPALAKRRTQLEEARQTQGRLRMFHRAMFGLKTVLPKTSETIGLLERTLISEADLEGLTEDERQRPPMWAETPDVRIDANEVVTRMESRMRSRSAWWVVGTSVGFEAVVLALCVFIFSRRDF